MLAHWAAQVPASLKVLFGNHVDVLRPDVIAHQQFVPLLLLDISNLVACVVVSSAVVEQYANPLILPYENIADQLAAAPVPSAL